MTVTGDDAPGKQVVRCGSLETVNGGDLLSADTEAGRVVWKDKTGTQREVTLGPHAITITESYSYGR